MSHSANLKQRAIKSLAWLGDALFELQVRQGLLEQGDFQARDLDKMGANLARAETQAALLQELLEELNEEESQVANRGKNASVRAGGRGVRSTKQYRLATGLEALVAHWHLSGEEGAARMKALLEPKLQTRIQAQVLAFREAKKK